MSEQLLNEWRQAVLRGRTIDAADADELEEHLRDSMHELSVAGLTEEESFLIAVRRLGEVDALTAEYAREHGDRLWKQLTVAPPAAESGTSLGAMLVFAAIAAVVIQVARLAWWPHMDQAWFGRDLGFFVLPVLGAYFAFMRRLPARRIVPIAAVVAGLALVVNLFPFPNGSTTDLIVAIHLPIVLWLAVGVAYLGGEIRTGDRRMDFLRFTGEWIVYFALIALAGGVLIGLMIGVLSAVAPGSTEIVTTWVIPSGVAGAVIVAAWLVEAKKSVIENIAPVLTAVFTPLFAAMLLVATAVYAVSGIGRDFDRELLILFDAVLVVVVGLVIYGISARRDHRVGVMDLLRLVAVAAAVLLDALVVASMLARVGEFGFTANRVVALGLNLLLLVNLVVTAVLLIGMLRHRIPPSRLDRWQTAYLPVIGAWVLLVVLAVPPVFGFA